MLDTLTRGPATAGELAALLPIARPGVSRHLRVLREAGLVTGRTSGTRHLYRVDPDGLTTLRAYVDRFWDDVLGAFTSYAEGER